MPLSRIGRAAIALSAGSLGLIGCAGPRFVDPDIRTQVVELRNNSGADADVRVVQQRQPERRVRVASGSTVRLTVHGNELAHRPSIYVRLGGSPEVEMALPPGRETLEDAAGNPSIYVLERDSTGRLQAVLLRSE